MVAPFSSPACPFYFGTRRWITNEGLGPRSDPVSDTGEVVTLDAYSHHVVIGAVLPKELLEYYRAKTFDLMCRHHTPDDHWVCTRTRDHWGPCVACADDKIVHAVFHVGSLPATGWWVVEE